MNIGLRTCLLALGFAGVSAVSAQPTDNAVTASGIDLGAYDASWIDALPWSTVTTTAAVADDSGDDLATVQAEIFALSANGGGVLYFPAGTYNFSDHLYLADGVILRGATPSETDARGSFTTDAAGVRTYTLTYDPPTNFAFPVFIQDYATDMRRVEGTARQNYFKQILVGKSDGGGGVLPDATHASDYGLVNIDINGAIISIGDRSPDDLEWGTSIPKNNVTGKNILIFGNRLNNGTALAPNVPEQGQNIWQIWPTRNRGKIDVVSAGNTLIANNLVGDMHYKYYVLGDTSQVIMDYVAYLGQSGEPIERQYRQRDASGSSMNAPNDVVRFSDGYGIRLNHVLDYETAHSAIQEPSKHREGQGIINNFHFGTTRVGFMGAGNGLIVKGNVREDMMGVKYEYINERGTALITNNSATQENRGIDITGGHDVIAEDNYVRVKRGTFASGYPTIDGEGLLLQESSSTFHPVNWTIRNNIVHSYIGLYRIRYADSIVFEGNTVYNDPLYTDGSVNGSQGRVGGSVVFNNNTAEAIYAKYNIKPRNLSIDLGSGNTPPASIVEGGNGGAPAGVAAVDAIPGIEILYPTKADMAALTEGAEVTVRVKITRDPADTVAVSGVKVWDGVTNYPANGKIAGTYWDFDGSEVGKPAGIALNLVEPDAVTGAIGGGVYEGSWTVPAEFDLRGLLVAEVRLNGQPGVTEEWIERSWAFMSEGSAEPVAPTIVSGPTGATVEQGAAVELTVTATGTAPLSYQWKKDGVDIEGATSASYVIASASPGDAGNYTVVVSNAQGDATSTAARVNVLSPLPYAETFDGLSLGDLSGQNGWSYTNDSASRLPVAGVRVESASLSWTAADGGTIDGGTQHLYLGARTEEFGNVKMDRWLSHSPVSFAGPVYFRFLMNMSAPVNGTLTDPSELFFGLTSNASISGAPWNAYVAIKHQNLTENAQIGVETTASGGIVPVATVALDTTLLVVGKFEVNESGQVSGVKVWINPNHDGEATPDVNAVIETPTTVLAEQSYLKLRAQNMAARVDQILLASTWDEVVPAAGLPVAPTIVSHPTGATVEQGAAVELTVTATGTAPLSYQWKKDGVDIEGATSASYVIASASPGDAGNYTVVVSNAQGDATSTAARVNVLSPLPYAETFDGLSLGDLSGQNGWSYTNDSASRLPVAGVRVESASLSWTAADGGTIDGGTQHLYLGARTEEFGNVKMDRWLSHSPVSFAGPVYFRFLMNMSAPVNGTLTDPSELFFGLTSNASISGAPWNAYVAIKHQNLTENAQIGVETTASGGIVPVATVALDTTLLVVGKFEVNEAGQVSGVKVWINPNHDGEATPDVNAVIETPTTVLAEQSYLKLRAQNMAARVDQILLASTWDEVVPAAVVTEFAPVIVKNPLPRSVLVGEAVSFEVTATGTAPLSYQWRKDGVDIEGATSASYSLAAAALSDAGTYDVVVSNEVDSVTSTPAALSVSEPVTSDLVPLFAEHFDSGTTAENKARVDIVDLGWNIHHSFGGYYLNGLETGDVAPNDRIVFPTTTELGDPAKGQPYGYLGIFINNYVTYGPGTQEARPAIPGPHPVTGEYYNNRTLATFLWKEHAIAAGDRERIREFNFVQGNRDAIYHNFFPAVRIGEQWYVYRVSDEALAAVRILGRPSQNGSYGEESVFSGSQFSEAGGFPNYYNAQPYSFTWSEQGWTPLTFNGGTGTDSTVGMTLNAEAIGALPTGDITAVGVYSPENITNPYNFNGLRIDSIEILAEPPPPTDLFTFTFNNEGKVDNMDRPIQAGSWDGIYTSAALPLVTSDAVFADLSEGTTSDPTPGHYKAGFLFVSGKDDQPAPEGFLVYSTDTAVVDEVQAPAIGVNPQTKWYSDPYNSIANLNELTAGDLQELSMRIRPRNAATVRYHFALKLGGSWYVSEQAFQHSGSADWESVSLDVPTANWLGGVVGEGSLNLDFAANAPQVNTIATIGSDAALESVGIYIDTDASVGTNDTWARVDSITLSAIVPGIPAPVITTQPADTGVIIGGTAQFSVELADATDVTYQWRKDGEDLANETGATLTLINASNLDSGVYDVVITGPGGTTISDGATLTVFAVPEVSPLAISAGKGATLEFITVTADPAAPWTAVSDVTWISVDDGATGTGSGLVTIFINDNLGGLTRVGTLQVAGNEVVVTQTGDVTDLVPDATPWGEGEYENWYQSGMFGSFRFIETEDGAILYNLDLRGTMIVVPVDGLPAGTFWAYDVDLESWVFVDVSIHPWSYILDAGTWGYGYVHEVDRMVWFPTLAEWRTEEQIRGL